MSTPHLKRSGVKVAAASAAMARAGTVAEWRIAVGDFVEADALLVRLQ